MRTIFRAIIDSIREDFGQPVSLIRLLAEYPEIRMSLNTPPPSISVQSVVHWHELGTTSYSHYPSRESGKLMGWRLRDKYHYDSFTLYRPEYAQLGELNVTENWTCDISDVYGFSASKSDLQKFSSTDEMVETNSSDMIDAITHEKLAENLAHREIRIIHSPGSDYFVRYLWDGNLFLMNRGGSHHFAAAKYIAARLPVSVALRGKLNTYSLNALAIESLRRDYAMFVIPDDAPVSLGFHDAMMACRATWLWHYLPSPFHQARAILLPRNEDRSMAVADLLRSADVADLGQHLASLAA